MNLPFYPHRLTLKITDISFSPKMEEVAFNQIPTTSSWKFFPLFRTDARGLLHSWQIGFSILDPEHGTLVIDHGYVDGQLQHTEAEVVLNKSGKSIDQQGLLEARSRYKNKYFEGYRNGNTPLSEVDKGPMLAYKYELGEVKVWPVVVQPKLDGMRMLCRETSPDVYECRSRENRQLTHLTDIVDQVKVLMTYLPSGCQLDGELFNPALSFKQIIEAIKKVTAIHPRLKEVHYYIYDVIEAEGKPYEERYNLLIRAYERYLEDGHLNTRFQLVSAYPVNSHQEILAYHADFISQGFEGTMIRKLGAKTEYKRHRTKNLMKHKDFLDEEMEVLGVEECQGREAGLAKLKVRDVRGNELYVRPGGIFEDRKRWLEHPEEIVGQKVTVTYQELTEAGIPRFPVMKIIRNYES